VLGDGRLQTKGEEKVKWHPQPWAWRLEALQLEVGRREVGRREVGRREARQHQLFRVVLTANQIGDAAAIVAPRLPVAACSPVPRRLLLHQPQRLLPGLTSLQPLVQRHDWRLVLARLLGEQPTSRDMLRLHQRLQQMGWV